MDVLDFHPRLQVGCCSGLGVGMWYLGSALAISQVRTLYFCCHWWFDLQVRGTRRLEHQPGAVLMLSKLVAVYGSVTRRLRMISHTACCTPVATLHSNFNSSNLFGVMEEDHARTVLLKLLK